MSTKSWGSKSYKTFKKWRVNLAATVAFSNGFSEKNDSWEKRLRGNSEEEEETFYSNIQKKILASHPASERGKKKGERWRKEKVPNTCHPFPASVNWFKWHQTSFHSNARKTYSTLNRCTPSYMDHRLHALYVTSFHSILYALPAILTNRYLTSVGNLSLLKLARSFVWLSEYKSFSFRLHFTFISSALSLSRNSESAIKFGSEKWGNGVDVSVEPEANDRESHDR